MLQRSWASSLHCWFHWKPFVKERLRLFQCFCQDRGWRPEHFDEHSGKFAHICKPFKHRILPMLHPSLERCQVSNLYTPAHPGKAEVPHRHDWCHKSIYLPSAARVKRSQAAFLENFTLSMAKNTCARRLLLIIKTSRSAETVQSFMFPAELRRELGSVWWRIQSFDTIYRKGAKLV